MTDMTANVTLDTDLAARFPEAVTADARKGYVGYIVQPEKLIEVATALRDEMGYDYLSSITGVDYQPDGKMEVVYHLYRSTGGGALVLKAETPRDNAVVPSLVSVYPGAEFQEREAWDLLGIRFDGHPDLRRILMW
jgi:NADH-quinone oxidoreductase subunit C/D